MTYSALRIGLLAACFALGYWAGLRTWLLLVVATLVAWGLSYVLLGGPRDAAARYLADRVERPGGGRGDRARAAEADAAFEDAAVDDAERGARAAGSSRGGAVGSSRGADAADAADAGPAPERPGYPGETARPSPNSTP